MLSSLGSEKVYHTGFEGTFPDSKKMIEIQRFSWYNSDRKFRPERYTFPEKGTFPDGRAEKSAPSAVFGQLRERLVFADAPGEGGGQAYSTHSPPSKMATSRPSRVRPVMRVSAAPIMTSSWMRDWFIPRATSSASVRALPPRVVPG